MRYKYKTSGVCASTIEFDIDNDIVTNMSINGGCDGNHKGIISLVDGMSVDDIEKKLSGIKCGFRNTSCPDQIAKAVREASNKCKE